MFLFCFTMDPVYMRMRAAMGEEGALYAYCDDSYLILEPKKLAGVLTQASTTFGKIGLRIGL